MLSSCVYLRACLNEAMRLQPAVGGVLPRTILSPGLTICNEFFPAGTIVGVSSYAVHHNIEWFPEPFKFKPERWMKEYQANNSDIQRAHEAFFSFSQGPRGCVGKHLAYVEMSMAVAYIAWRFDIQPSKRIDGEMERGEDMPDWVTEMQMRGELASTDMFVSHPIDGPFLKFREWH
jgi:cytochrome P450